MASVLVSGESVSAKAGCAGGTVVVGIAGTNEIPTPANAPDGSSQPKTNAAMIGETGRTIQLRPAARPAAGAGARPATGTRAEARARLTILLMMPLTQRLNTSKSFPMVWLARSAGR